MYTRSCKTRNSDVLLDITKHDGIGAASYFEVEDLNQKSVKIKRRNSVRADWKQQVLGRCNG